MLGEAGTGKGRGVEATGSLSVEDRGQDHGLSRVEGSGERQPVSQGVINVGVVPHAWRITSEGLQLTDMSVTRDSAAIGQTEGVNVFSSRAASPFRTVGQEQRGQQGRPVSTPPATPPRRDSGWSGARRLNVGERGMIGNGGSGRGVRAGARKWEASRSPPRREYRSTSATGSPGVIKPTIVYPVSPGERKSNRLRWLHVRCPRRCRHFLRRRR